MRQRIRDHFDGKGAGCTKKYTPTEVCLLWPAQNAAAEAYVYFALLETKPAAFVSGWTQTSWNPSPMVHLLTREARCNLRGECFTCNEKGHVAIDCPRDRQNVKTCFYPCKAPGCGRLMYLTSTGQTPTSLSSEAKLSAVDGDTIGSIGEGSSVNVPTAGPTSVVNMNTCSQSMSQHLPVESVELASIPYRPRAPASGEAALSSTKRQRLLGQHVPACETDSHASVCRADRPGPDVSFENAWFASRKKARSGEQKELGSLRDIVALMKTRKSIAAEKHLDDRINVWMRRYSRQDPEDCEMSVPEFSSKKGGGKGGVGVIQDFVSQIWQELAS